MNLRMKLQRLRKGRREEAVRIICDESNYEIYWMKLRKEKDNSRFGEFVRKDEGSGTESKRSLTLGGVLM